MKKLTPIILFALYVIVFTICAINPYSRTVWWAENLPILIIVATIAVISKYYTFTPLSYILMACLVIFHTIGGHYTFERVPFDLVTNFFGFSRNHYDRMAHFSVGFYAYAIAEFLLFRSLVRSRWVLILFPIFAIFTTAAVYEIFEWQYAVSADPSAGIAVLGSQGDIWDAQKDMLADGLGAIFAMALFWLIYQKPIANIGNAA
ncbi:MAG: DUF2238 domain-containing protein [Desulfobacteraceae bacterium]|nr:MAG: DUF2238 domain-containing protein [Desulfobacteraceae bacterium]